MGFHLKTASYSNKGSVRADNQDSYVVGISSFAVFDGMGGESCGAAASKTAAYIFKKCLLSKDFKSEEELRNSIIEFSDESQSAIRQLLDRNNAMHGGTTAAGISFVNENALTYYIGDSRIYLLRKGRLFLLSHDMTAAQQEIDKGSMNPDAARKSRGWHLLTSYLGDTLSVIHADKMLQTENGDRFFLCTDGVSDAIPDRRLKSILRWPRIIAECFIRHSAMKNGNDNFTFIIIDVTRN